MTILMVLASAVAVAIAGLIHLQKNRAPKGWRAGDPCPHCGKPLAFGHGRSIVTLGRPVPWLRCEGWPKCEFSTQRIRPDTASPMQRGSPRSQQAHKIR